MHRGVKNIVTNILKGSLSPYNPGKISGFSESKNRWKPGDLSSKHPFLSMPNFLIGKKKKYIFRIN